jgi:hypothetical protein
MNKVAKYGSVGILLFTLLACSAFPSGRGEEPSGKLETRIFWVLDGEMSAESAEMYLERYLFPTSLAAMLWMDFSVRGDEIRLDTAGGYRIVRKQRVLAETVDSLAVYGYDLIVDVTLPAEAPERGSREGYEVRFSYPGAADPGSGSSAAAVNPQPLQQALIAGIRDDGRSAGKARVEQIEYLGAGRFTATVSIGD